MPTVETSVLIPAPLETVYAIAKDTARYPDYMKEVQSIAITEQEALANGQRVVADWVGVIPQFGLKVRWTQEETWDDATHSSQFRQLKGDYDHMAGTWRFAEEDGGTRFDQSLEYEYNVPTLGPLVKRVILAVVKNNLEAINAAFAKQAAQRSV